MPSGSFRSSFWVQIKLLIWIWVLQPPGPKTWLWGQTGLNQNLDDFLNFFLIPVYR